MPEPIAAQHEKCPSCGAGLPPNAVLCIHCGLNLKTGQMLRSGMEDGKPAHRPKATKGGEKNARTKWALGIALLVVAAASAALYPLRNALQARRHATPEAKQEAASGVGQTSQPEAGAATQPTEPSTDTGSENYRKWMAERALTTKREGHLVAKGPQFVVAGIVEGLAASPFWTELVRVLDEVSPPVPLALVCEIQEGADLPGESRLGAIQLRAFPEGEEGGKSFLVARAECFRPSRAKRVTGLSATDTGRMLAEQRAAAHIVRTLPLVAATIAARLPRVADRVLPRAEEWLSSQDAGLVCSACAFLSLRAKEEQDGRLLAPLCRLLGATSDDHRYLALATLCVRDRRADAASLPHVLPLLDDGDRMVREQALRYLEEYPLAEASLPHLRSAVESGGSAGRLWLVRRLLAVQPGQAAARVAGSILFAAAASENDPAAKARLLDLSTRAPFVGRFEEFSSSMSVEEIVPCLLAPNAGLSLSACRVLCARAKKGQDFAAAMPALQEAAASSQGAWRVLGALATRSARPEDRLATVAYRQGWTALARGEPHASGWLLNAEDGGTVAALARRDVRLQKTVATAMLRQDDPLLCMGLDCPATVPAGEPNGVGAVLLVLGWRKLDDEGKAKALAYMARGMEGSDEHTRVAIARTFLVAHANQIFLDTEVGGFRVRAGLCRDSAEEIVLAALTSPDLQIRRQAVWAAGKAVAPDVLREHIAAIGRILVEAAIAMEPARMEEDACRLAAPYRVDFSWRIDTKAASPTGDARIQEGVWPQATLAIQQALRDASIPDARKERIARALGCAPAVAPAMP